MSGELRVMWCDVPSEVKAGVRTILEAWGFLVPRWVESLAVQYYPVRLEEDMANTAADAACNADPEYRQAQLLIYGGWLSAPAEERERNILHEILHMPLAPMVIEHEELLQRTLADGGAPQFHDYAAEQWRRVFEGAVQDLRNSLVLLEYTPPTKLLEVDGAAE